jgi:hypothetical protein
MVVSDLLALTALGVAASIMFCLSLCGFGRTGRLILAASSAVCDGLTCSMLASLVPAPAVAALAAWPAVVVLRTRASRALLAFMDSHPCPESAQQYAGEVEDRRRQSGLAVGIQSTVTVLLAGAAIGWLYLSVQLTLVVGGAFVLNWVLGR